MAVTRNGRKRQARDARGRFTSNANGGRRRRATQSSLDGLGGVESLNRVSFARRVGLQYQGDRDVYEVAGYRRVLHFEDYWERYRRQDIAGRIVDIFPETTWRRAPLVIEPPDRDDTRFVRDLEELTDRLQLWNRLERVDKLAGIGRYGMLLIGAPGELDTPLPNLRGPQDVLYLQPFPEGSTRIEINTDTSDPRFGLPEMYQLNLSPDIESGAVGLSNRQVALTALRNKRVHWTRIIHVAENLLSDDVFGIPRLQRSLNRLFDLEKIVASTGESFWQLVAGILQASIDPEMEFEDEDRRQLDKDLREIYHDLRRTFYGQGIELNWLRSEPPQPKEAADLILMLIASSYGLPKRVLFGSETGERSSTEDQKQFLGMIASRQVQFAEPMILRALIDRLVDHGGLAEPGEDGYEVEWPELFEVPESETAEANLARARAAKELTPMGGDPLEIVEVTEERDVFLIPRTPEMADALRAEREADEEEQARRAEEALERMGQGEPTEGGEPPDEEGLEEAA